MCLTLHFFELVHPPTDTVVSFYNAVEAQFCCQFMSIREGCIDLMLYPHAELFFQEFLMVL